MFMLNVALLQIASHGFDQEANLEKGIAYCRKAKALGADIAVFPEMWNIGYTAYAPSVFEERFDPTDPKERAQAKDWQARAIDAHSEFVPRYQALAKELEMAVAITYLEKGLSAPFNTVSLINRHGEIVLTYRKVHTCDFSLEAFCTSGNDFPVCDLETKKGNVKIGCMICFDREFPESARLLMLKGAEIILVPNACELEQNRIAQIRTRAYENMVGIAVVNYPAPQENGHSIAFDGMAFEYGQSRDHLLIEAPKKEGIFMASFDPDRMRQYRQKEVWGNAYRKPQTYKALCDLFNT
ncbi:MAG: carbon-nitrogen hydrolase family protein [Gammaproteobacteria bacterium]|nr:carbon-nitrogen hydrolase family protein [Gammaproteobacteria bacterium]